MITRRELLGSVSLAAAAPQRPNVVLILADDLGYGDLGCYGCEIPTPNLDRLAAEGVRFTQGYVASPICSPSRVAITTGQYPSRHLIFSFLNTRKRQRELGMRDYLDVRAPSIARIFQQAGYATAHFGKWHMGGGRDVDDAPLISEYGFDETLTSFEGLGDRVLPPGNLSEMSAKLGRGKISRAALNELTEIYVNRSIDFVKRNATRPFYLQMWPNDPHDPFDPKPELLKKYERFSKNKYLQQYYATIDDMDRQIGRLVETIDGMGLAERTLFVFLSDNGPTAWPRYYKEGLEPPGSTAGLRGRKWSLYEGGVRVPFLARWKGRIPAGKVNRDTVVCAVDLFPTLCRLAGVKAPQADFDGEDLSAAFLGGAAQRKRDLFWEYGRDATFIYPGREWDRSPNLALRSGQWKLLMNDDGSRVELYDFSRSHVEERSVAEQNPGITQRLSKRLLEWRRALPVLKG